MPTYEYECKKCGHRFDIFQNISDKKVKKCPQCGGKVQRLIHGGTGVIFKGSGFYATDYAKNNSDQKTRCGKDTPCCGKAEPCDKPSCD